MENFYIGTGQQLVDRQDLSQDPYIDNGNAGFFCKECDMPEPYHSNNCTIEKETHHE